MKRPTEAQIRERAYKIFLARGGKPGHEMNDWIQAEYELMQLPIEKIAKLDPPKIKGRRKSVISVVRAALSMIGAGK